MKYKVKLKRSKEGFSVWCPGLPGCWSQGNTEEEALNNIQDAISEYLAAAEEISKGDIARLVEIPVQNDLPNISGINHKHAVRALKKAGFRILRQGKHIIMTDNERILTIPRANPINGYTMAGIVKDSGLSIEEFKRLI